MDYVLSFTKNRDQPQNRQVCLTMPVWHTNSCTSYLQSVGKALKGEGIVLANSDMLEAEFRSGKLVRIGEVGLTPKKSYFLCYKENVPLAQSTIKLRDFLTNDT
jgi:LysR family glycine cleavage system transcriptional activator